MPLANKEDQLSFQLPPEIQGNDFGSLITKPEDELKLSRKRPARLVVPAVCYAGLDLVEKIKRMDYYVKEFEGRDFVVVIKKARREVMKDRHAFVLDISGDTKQAFFSVIDGHGGHGAADYVAENLGTNVVNELKVNLLQVEAGFAFAPTTYFLPCIMWLSIYKPRMFSLSTGPVLHRYTSTR